jgi:hypothetical protein
MQLFHVVASKWKPEWHTMVSARRIDSNQSILGRIIPSEKENSQALVSLPVIEIEVGPPADVTALASYSQKLSDEPHHLLAHRIVEIIPSYRPEQGNAPRAKVRQEIVLRELLPLPSMGMPLLISSAIR